MVTRYAALEEPIAFVKRMPETETVLEYVTRQSMQ